MKKEICIYCLEEKSVSSFSGREHVIPQSFGRFTPDNIILKNMVCDECNSFFGKDHDQILARDSIEGIFRYIYRIADLPNSSSEKFKRQRTIIKFAGNGILQGALLDLSNIPEDGNAPLKVEITPQVVVYKKNSNKKVHIPIDKIRRKEDLVNEEFDLNKVELLLNSESKEKESISKLKQLGIPFVKYLTIRGEELNLKYGDLIRANIRAQIDERLHRAIAKISFNYLAAIMGKQFVLNNCFNEIRDFIRQGKKNDQALVNEENKKFKIGKEIPNGHFLLIDWDPQQFGITGIVSLFNKIIYKIKLCRIFKGLIRNIAKGHYFDINSHEVVQIQKSRLILI